LLGSAAQELGRHPIAELDERPRYLALDQIPVGLGRVAFQLRPHAAGALANAGRLSTKFGIGDHFLHVAKSIRPFAEAVAGERTKHVGRTEIVERPGRATEVAGLALAALALAAFSLTELPWLRLAGLLLLGWPFSTFATARFPALTLLACFPLARLLALLLTAGFLSLTVLRFTRLWLAFTTLTALAAFLTLLFPLLTLAFLSLPLFARA
jgi:hypothetical protein